MENDNIAKHAMRWRDEYSTGIQEIDNEHKAIIAKLNEIMQEFEKSDGQSDIDSIVDFLDSELDKHFEHEERIQKLCEYPYYRSHRMEHDEFKMTVLKIKYVTNVDKKFEGVNVDIYRDVFGWLISHIKNEDRQFAEYYKKYRLKK